MPSLKSQLMALVAGVGFTAAPALAEPKPEHHSTPPAHNNTKPAKPDHNKPDHNKPDHNKPDHALHEFKEHHPGLEHPGHAIRNDFHEARHDFREHHPIIAGIHHDLHEAWRDFREGRETAAAKDLGKALQLALSAAKHEAYEKGEGSLLLIPATSGTQTGGGSGGSGQGGGSGDSPLQRALHHLSEARIELRRDEDARAERHIREAMREVAEAGGQRSGNHAQSGSATSSTTSTSTSTKPLGTASTTTQQSSQHGVHLQESVKFMNAALKNINGGHDERAAIDIHDAHEQIKEAIYHSSVASK
jgi:hypothetical protein